jgi:hypothetical protein
VLVRLGVDGLAVPGAGREGESDPGVTGSGGALVYRQDMADTGGVEGDSGLFEGFADGCGQDAFILFHVS